MGNILRAKTVMLAAATAVVASSCGFVSDGTESFRPPLAPVVAQASCDLPDIVARLTSRSAGERQGEGSMPKGFMPTRVVSCQRADGPDGATAIDEVTLEGDVDAVVDALSRPSERTDKNTSVSCAYATYAPAAIWWVSSAGAVRAAWPSLVCNLRDDPLAPLSALRETRRVTARTLTSSPQSQCSNGYSVFQTTDDGDGGGPEPGFTRRPTVRLPQGPIAELTACTYRVVRSPTGDVQDLAGLGSRTLSAVASTQLIREVLSAPQAQPCRIDASEVTFVTLFRPDGSGGGTLVRPDRVASSRSRLSNNHRKQDPSTSCRVDMARSAMSESPE